MIEFLEQEKQVSIAEIEELEQKYNFLFPNEIKCFLLEHNGAIPLKRFVKVKNQEYVIDRFLAIKYGSYDTYEETFNDLFDILPNGMIPFASDTFGNYFVFDKEGKIYFLEMEELITSFLFQSFNDFITSLDT